MTMAPAEEKASILAIANGAHVPDGILDWMFAEGYVAAVHVVTKEPVPRGHPQSVLRITELGWTHLHGAPVSRGPQERTKP